MREICKALENLPNDILVISLCVNAKNESKGIHTFFSTHLTVRDESYLTEMNLGTCTCICTLNGH